MARPRKPTAVKRLQGTLQKCRTNPNEPIPKMPIDRFEPPVFFTETQRDLWLFAISQMPSGMLSGLDFGIFSRWCIMYDQFVELTKSVNENGAVMYDELGVPFANPLVNTLNKLAVSLRGIETELGFTPASRSKVSLDSKEETKNKFMEV